MSKPEQDSKLLTNIYREVGEARTQIKVINEKLDSHINLTLKELKSINELDNEQNRILDVHIAGVNTLKELYVAHRKETSEQIRLLRDSLECQKKELQARLTALEESEKLIKYLGKVIMWVGTLTIGAIITSYVKGWF